MRALQRSPAQQFLSSEALMADQEQQAAATSTAKPKPGRKKGSRAQKAASKKAKAKSTAKRGPGRPKGSKNRFVSKKKGRKSRTRYTPARRAEILAAAKQKGLTAIQVQKRFGVTPVTYYSWRKTAGTSSKRGRPAGAVRIGGGDPSNCDRKCRPGSATSCPRLCVPRWSRTSSLP
jgi:transposase-like protein